MISFQTFGQSEHTEKFEYSETGINDYLVIKVEVLRANVKPHDFKLYLKDDNNCHFRLKCVCTRVKM